jgi:hypothetical protein
LIGLIAKGIYDAVEYKRKEGNGNGKNARDTRPISMNGFSEVALNMTDQSKKTQK